MSKKKGVSRGPGNYKRPGDGLRGAIDNRVQYALEVGYTLGQVRGQSDLCMALGRMGYGPKRFKALSDELKKVCADYNGLEKADNAEDPTKTYTMACYDRELEQYVGEYFVPWDTREDVTLKTTGIRFVEIAEARKEAGI